MAFVGTWESRTTKFRFSYSVFEVANISQQDSDSKVCNTSYLTIDLDMVKFNILSS